MLRDDIVRQLSEAGDKLCIIANGNARVTAKSYINVHEDSLEFDWDHYDFDDIEYIGDYRLADGVWPEWGSDPEFFYVKDDKIVPSKAVIPPYSSIVKRDGFQGELNPGSNTCRQVSGNNIAEALKEAYEYGEMAGAKLSLSVGVEIDKETFYNLPVGERRFGCSPTANVHENKKRVSGTRTRFRSGGGHIHVGGARVRNLYREDPKKLITMIDIVCGVGSVLIDRDVANIERRKHYGRAGEHREKSYGLEYRVPSNFWLRSYTLWSTVTGLLRNALNICEIPELRDEILQAIDVKDVRDAINNNDKELALKVFKQYAEIIEKRKVVFEGGLSFHNIYKFIRWASMADPISVLRVPTVEHSLDEWERHCEYEDVPGLESFLLDNF